MIRLVTVALFVQLIQFVSADNSSCTFTALRDDTQSSITPVLEKHQALLLMILGFGGLSITVGVLHHAVRKNVYRDSHNLDTVFDAGGKVTLGLTAVTVTSQMLWPADFLQSATIMSKIIYARFGKPAHIVFCVIALISNLNTVMALVLAAKTAMDVLVKDVSDEMVLLLLAFLFGSYCLIGGLGTTFYISYFNTALTFVSVLVFVVNVSYFQSDDEVISKENMYNAMKCIKGPEGNYENSFLTFKTRGGILYGVLLFLMGTSVSFCDQANWQSRIAAKPAQGVAGFFIAAFLWFAIPLTITMTASTAYIAMSYQNGSHLLSSTDIDSGFITPYVMQNIMGQTGAYLLITMVTMALMSTGSGEVMAVSSIIVYDIYRVYINPFRKDFQISSCPLCGKEKMCSRSENSVCICPSVLSCKACENDVLVRLKGKQYHSPYECETHASYRRYEDELLHYKSWCMILVTIGIVPYGLIIINSGINLNWAVYTMQGLFSAFLGPLLLTILWPKCTSKGVISGSIFGGIAYFAGVLVVAELIYDQGLRNFLTNTSSEYSLLGGVISGGTVSITLTVIVSLLTQEIKSDRDLESVWNCTLSIDNPLNPWRRMYEEELAAINILTDTPITISHMSQIFRKARFFAIIGGIISVCIFGVIIPASVLSIDILTFDQFSAWFNVCQIWVMIAAAFAILVPPLEEITQIIRFYLKHKSERHTSHEESRKVMNENIDHTKF